MPKLSKPGFTAPLCCSCSTVDCGTFCYGICCHQCAEYEVIAAVKPEDKTPYLISCVSIIACSAALSSAAVVAPVVVAPINAAACPFMAATNIFFAWRRRDASKKLVGLDESNPCEIFCENWFCDHCALLRAARAGAPPRPFPRRCASPPHRLPACRPRSASQAL